MEYGHLLIDVSGPLATVTLNRPEVRNALNEQTLAELTDCFGQLAGGSAKSRANQTVPRVIVLRGAGPDFCAGADINWMRRASDYSPAKNRADARKLVDALRAIDECPLPVIGRIHGGIYGGGLGLAAACDVVIADEGARMCFSECRLGILPAVVTSFVLPKIGLSQTRRLYLTSEVFGMDLAIRIGLAHEAAPSAGLDAAVERIAGSVLQNGPLAVSLAKETLRRMAGLDRAARIKLSLDALVKARSSPEAKEGFSAFLEKRPPAWAPAASKIRG